MHSRRCATQPRTWSPTHRKEGSELDQEDQREPRADWQLRCDLHIQLCRAGKGHGQDRCCHLPHLQGAADQKNPGAGEGLLFRIKSGSLQTVPEDEKSKTNGTILYNPKTGRMESAKISIKLKGKLTVTIGDTDTKVELEQVQKTSIKTQDASFLQKK